MVTEVFSLPTQMNWRAQGKKGEKESQVSPCKVEPESPHSTEWHVKSAAGDPGGWATLGLTCPASPLAGAIVAGEEGWLPTECGVSF